MCKTKRLKIPSTHTHTHTHNVQGHYYIIGRQNYGFITMHDVIILNIETEFRLSASIYICVGITYTYYIVLCHLLSTGIITRASDDFIR